MDCGYTNISCSNNITEYTLINDDDEDDGYLHEGYLPRAIFQMTLVLIETIVGLLGNGILGYLIVARKRLRTVCNLYILSRAISDIMFLLPNILAFITTVKMKFIFGYGGCIFYTVVVQITALVSSYTLVLMCIDCYIGTRIGHHAPTFRAKLMKISLGILWITGAALSKVVVMFRPYNELRSEEGKDVRAYCLLVPFFYAPTPESYILSIFFGLIIPLSLIWVFIGISFPQKTREIPYTNRDDEVSEQGEYGEGGGARGEDAAEGEAVFRKRFIVVLAVLFTVSQLAFWATTMTHIHTLQIYVPYLYEGGATLLDLNAALNPIFCILFVKDLYQEFVKHLPTHKRAGNPLQAVYVRYPQSSNT